jgi:hypothetical protein
MNRASIRAALAIGLWAVPATAASALSGQCGPLRQVASLDMAPVSGTPLMAAPLVIDGRPVRLLLDTGAGASSLTPSAAAKLDLHPRDSGNVHLLDAQGRAVHRYYRTDSLTISGLTAHGIPFIQDGMADDMQVDGAFGPDLMLRYDVEMDFTAGKLTYFSQDHCAGHIVHWSAETVAQIPITIASRAGDYPAPMGKADASLFLIVTGGAPILGTDIRVEVMLDGHVFTANIDTGTEVSSINSSAARRFYEIPANELGALSGGETPSSVPGGGAIAGGTESVTVTGFRAEHRFHNLTFGGVTVTNPLFVLPRPPADAGRVGSARRPDITIGMNVLRALHLYFAFKERVLYVSAADAAQPVQGKQNHE